MARYWRDALDLAGYFSALATPRPITKRSLINRLSIVSIINCLPVFCARHREEGHATFCRLLHFCSEVGFVNPVLLLYFCSSAVSFAVSCASCPLAGTARYGAVGREAMLLSADPDGWLDRGGMAWHGAAGAGERICVFRLKIAMMSTFSIL
ncbi:hypothetical protein [Aeromonas allosaccharophila]|uniref:hypothetical protein n=1 Tax=Aeromonas allosaccharophila TaxID=656 RepID=UPI003005F18D